MLLPSAAAAAPIQVNTTADQNNGAAPCSLREAIFSANFDGAGGNGCANGAGTDAISFDPAVFVPGGVQEVIDLGLGEDTALSIISPLSITGPGASELAIDGQDSRIFSLTGSNTVSISGLTIRDGQLNGATDQMGAGVYNEADLTLSGVTVADNVADTDGAGASDVTGAGGGIYNDALGSLILDHSTVSGNTASALHPINSNSTAFGLGGGIYSAGELHIHHSVIDDNEAFAQDVFFASSPAATARGGGLHAVSPFDADHSSFTRNTTNAISGAASADSRGAGISSAANSSLELSTVAENTTAVNAPSNPTLGGAGVVVEGGTLEITGSTIARNGPDPMGPAFGGNVDIPAGSAIFENAIIAYPIGGTNNCSVFPGGTGTSNGFNLQFPVGPEPCYAPQATDLATDPMLAPALALDGGSTETLALMSGSPAIDAGSSAGQVFAGDQRGLGRPSDFFAIPNVGDGSDIGAYEVQSPDVPSPPATGATQPTATSSATPTPRKRTCKKRKGGKGAVAAKKKRKCKSKRK